VIFVRFPRSDRILFPVGLYIWVKVPRVWMGFFKV
jgi:hypothetical protein